MGTQLSLPKGAQPPIFGSCLLWPNGWMDKDATWYGSRPRPTLNCVRCAPSYTPRKKGTATPTLFWPICLLWPNGWMGEDAAWYRSRPHCTTLFTGEFGEHCTRLGPSSRKRGTAAPLFSAHVYCGHGRPSQLLLSSSNYADPLIASPTAIAV